MSRPTKSLEARDRLGVYKQLADVPDQYRFHQYADAYVGQTTWRKFCETHEYELGDSESFRQKVDRAGEHWCGFMAGRRHHALATPRDVEDWSTALLDEFTLNTAYKYWIRVEHFYRWLQWHTEHPHVYHPALMAVVQFDDAAAKIWGRKATHVRQKREQRI